MDIRYVGRRMAYRGLLRTVARSMHRYVYDDNIGTVKPLAFNVVGYFLKQTEVEIVH